MHEAQRLEGAEHRIAVVVESETVGESPPVAETTDTGVPPQSSLLTAEPAPDGVVAPFASKTEATTGVEGDGPASLLKADLLEASFALLAPRGDALVDRFYFRLFRAAPEAYHMFPQGRFTEQKRKLLAAIKLVVNSARKPEAVAPVVQELGVKHVGYGVVAEHYPLVGSILLATLAEIAGDAWSEEVERAWAEAYAVVSSVMLESAAAA